MEQIFEALRQIKDMRFMTDNGVLWMTFVEHLL